MELIARDGIILKPIRVRRRRQHDSDFVRAARAMEEWSPEYADVYKGLILNQMDKNQPGEEL